MNEPSTAPRVVMIGGGTGSFTLLSNLKNYVQDITAIVNMVDDGGSTGVLRDELGVLPPGDIRQCLVALSDAPEKMRQLFTYRFPEGTFEGHSFGNLFLTAVEKMSDDFDEAIRLASEVLHVKGEVVPVTLDKTTLVLKDGRRVVRGEFKIINEKLRGKSAPKLSLEPNAKLNPRAKAAIARADMIVLAPGNVYGSLLPTLVVDGMKQAIQKSNAKLVQVVNLVVKPGQTDGFTVADFVDTFESYIGKGRVGYVLYNNQEPNKQMLKRYAKEGELPVEFDEEQLECKSYKAIGDKFISNYIHKQDKRDTRIERTLIRHDADLVSRHLMRIFYE